MVIEAKSDNGFSFRVCIRFYERRGGFAADDGLQRAKLRFAHADGKTLDHDGLLGPVGKAERGQRRPQPVLMRANADVNGDGFAVGELPEQVGEQGRAVVEDTGVKIRLNPDPKRAAADVEDATDKHPVTPGAIRPARELLGEMLLELGRPADALPEFAAVLNAAPYRFNALYGAGRAAQLAGNDAKAREYFAKLIQLGREADTNRAELTEAKKFLSSSAKARAS